VSVARESDDERAVDPLGIAAGAPEQSAVARGLGAGRRAGRRGERGPARVLLEAAPGAAPARPAPGNDAEVAELRPEPGAAAEQGARHDDPAPEAGADRRQHE